MTRLVSQHEDDATRKLPAMPFRFVFGGVNFGGDSNGGVFVGSNSLLMFGAGSTAYEGLGQAVPALKSVHIGSKDTSWQGLWAQVQGSGASQRLRVRYEGSVCTLKPPDPQVVWEASLWSNSSLTLCVGTHWNAYSDAGAQAGVSSGTGRWLAALQLQQNRHYVINGLATAPSG
jgi:hypothetical protein